MQILIINCSPVRDGATAEICRIIAGRLGSACAVDSVCIDDYDVAFCKGCRSCHTTAQCVLSDGAERLVGQIDRADAIICVSPSYWADVPGQFKAFIDRCTPWCNTHEPHASLRPGKKGFTAVLRTGGGMKECERLIATIEHFYGHMEIEPCGSIGLCSVENRRDAVCRADEIYDFCGRVLRALGAGPQV